MRSSSSPFTSPSGLVDKRLQPMWEQIDQVRTLLPQIAHVSYYMESLFNLDRNLSLLADENVDHHILKDITIFQGASAYELALADGFVGSQAAWFASFKGDQGDPGVIDASTLLDIQTNIQTNATNIAALTLLTNTLSSYTPLSTYNARVTSVNNSLNALQAAVDVLEAALPPTIPTNLEINTIAQGVYDSNIVSVLTSLGLLDTQNTAITGLIDQLEIERIASDLAFSEFLIANSTTLTRVTALEAASTNQSASIVSLQSVTATAASDITLLQAQDVTSNAQIVSLQTVTSNQATSINNLQVANNANNASILAESIVRADGDSAVASTVTTLTANFSGRTSGGILNPNAFFDEGPASVGAIPARWSDWAFGASITRVEAKPFGGVGLHAVMIPQSGTPTDRGWLQVVGSGAIRAGNKYKIRADISRDTGSLTSSGVYIIFRNSVADGLTDARIFFSTDADTSGVVSASGDGRRVWEKIVTAPAGAFDIVIYPMQAWSGFTQTAQATTATIRWFELSVSNISSDTARITTAEAAIVSEASTRATADSASATTIANLRADTQIRGFLNFNPYFDQPTASPGVPAGWADWIGAAAVTTQVARAVAPLAGLNARTVALLSTDNVGVEQFLPLGGDWGGRSVAVRSRVRIHSGSNAGAGAYVIFYNADYSVSTGEYKMIFSTEPNTSGIVSTSHAGSTTYEKVLKVPPNTHNIRIIAITNYPGVFGTGTVKTLDWYECAISEVGGGVAGVTDLRQAITTNNSSTARLLLSVNTATNVATIVATAQSGDGIWNGSAIRLTADQITLSGDVIIDGGLGTTAYKQHLTGTAASHRFQFTSTGESLGGVDVVARDSPIELRVSGNLNITRPSGTLGVVAVALTWLKNGFSTGQSETIFKMSIGVGAEIIIPIFAETRLEGSSSGTDTFSVDFILLSDTGTGAVCYLRAAELVAMERPNGPETNDNQGNLNGTLIVI